jgi:hypothetical protein
MTFAKANPNVKIKVIPMNWMFPGRKAETMRDFLVAGLAISEAVRNSQGGIGLTEGSRLVNYCRNRVLTKDVTDGNVKFFSNQREAEIVLAAKVQRALDMKALLSLRLWYFLITTPEQPRVLLEDIKKWYEHGI